MVLKITHQRKNESPRWKKRCLFIIALSAFLACLTQDSWIGSRLLRQANPNLWHENPIVVEEYKLVFFTIPKVGCTEWKHLFRRMMGLPDIDLDKDFEALHDPHRNGLKYLKYYTPEQQTKILTSDEWTRAVFVREPKERVLSAFLNKFVNDHMFHDACCHKGSQEFRDDCLSRSSTDDFSYFLKRTLDCPNPHWSAQATVLDPLWWEKMTFVGYMDNVVGDAEKLLKSIKSKEGTTAWDDYGKTGWGKDGSYPFMVRDLAPHATNAHDKLRKYYNKCEEAFVEKHWDIEWDFDGYHFDKTSLFENHEDTSNCTMFH